MRRNSIVLGEKHIEGDYDRIMAAGEVQIDNSNIKKLYVAGEANINHSTIHKLRGGGEVNGNSVNFGNLKAAGEVKLSGVCKADIFVITGDLSADFLECRMLRIGSPSTKVKVQGRETGGSIQLKGSLKAETFENFYMIKLSCDYEFKNIISSAMLVCNGVIACDNFYSFGGGIVGESINADNITIVLSDDIDLQAVEGSNISICRSFREDKLFKSIPKSVHYKNCISNDSMVRISRIEGDKINIEHTNSDLVSGMDVVVGDLCVIDRLEYKNSVHVSEKAVVNEVIKI